MKRNARRAVLFVCLAASAALVQAAPASAGEACVKVGINAQPSGPCVAVPVGTKQCVGTEPPVAGVDVEVCAPLV